MTDAQERAKAIVKEWRKAGYVFEATLVRLIASALAQVEADTWEKAAQESQRRVTQGDLLNIYAGSELARLATYYFQQAQRAKEGT